MRRPVLTIFVVATAFAIVLAITAGVVLEHTHRTSSVPNRTATTRVLTAPTSASSASSAPAPAPNNTRLVAAIKGFATGYGTYLNGGTPAAMHSTGSVTATAQATQGGQIPVAFRDGQLHVKQLGSLESTCCSASVIVVLANREESYPFAEQLLYEGGRWLVDQITPADLSMDRRLPAPAHVTEPAGGAPAARAFALAYVNYKTGISSTPPAMTAAAAAQITDGTDSLTGQKLPHAAAQLAALKLGPPSGSEFAATATVAIAGVKQTFSFLMSKTPGGWKCEQFL